MVDETIEDARANDDAKPGLRRRAHAARAALSAADRAEAAASVCEHFFAGVSLAPHQVVAAYWAIGDELDCQPILVRLIDSGQTVVLPVVLGPDQPLEMRVWERGAALYEAGFGTLAPSPLAPLAQPDLVLMPLLGFDRLGTRLGYGGGYYDRTLAQMTTSPTLIGLAFAAQELDAIPSESHDVPLDAVITEAGIRHFGAGA